VLLVRHLQHWSCCTVSLIQKIMRTFDNNDGGGSLTAWSCQQRVTKQKTENGLTNSHAVRAYADSRVATTLLSSSIETLYST
jgi:hypothetical protein